MGISSEDPTYGTPRHEFENPTVPGIPVAGPADDITQPPQRAAQEFDVTMLTLGEVAAIENFAGQTIGALSDPTAPKGMLLQGLAWAIKHRSDPKFTFAMGATVTFGEIQELLGSQNTAEDAAPSR